MLRRRSAQTDDSAEEMRGTASVFRRSWPAVTDRTDGDESVDGGLCVRLLDAGMVAQEVIVPEQPSKSRTLTFDRPGLALVQHSTGSESVTGIAGPSLTLVEPGDRIVVLPPGEVLLPLVVNAPDGHSVHFSAVVSVCEPGRFVAAIVQDEPAYTELELARRLSRDGALRLAVQRALSEFGSSISEALEATLTEPFDHLFGLALREVLSDVALVDGVGKRPGVVVGGRWELIERLGRGATGEVWLVRDPARPAELRALKVLRDPRAAALVDREARRILRLERRDINFRHIARPLDVVSLETPALLYEHVKGETLHRYVEASGGRLSRPESLAITEQLLDGLGELHRAGVVHCDLHPGNVMITVSPAGPQVKILDLGMSTLAQLDEPIDSLSRTSGALLPTHAFSEQPHIGRELDARTDLYSAGVLLWWMLSGQEGLPVGVRLEDAWHGVDEQALSLVRRSALGPREHRYASASAMRGDLDKARRRLAQPTRRSKPRRTAKSRPQHGVVRVTKAIIVVALFAFGALLLGGGLLLGLTRVAALARGAAVAAVVVVAVPLALLTLAILAAMLILLV